MKICSKCKDEKELSEFNKDKSRKDGLNHKCRECGKEYYHGYKGDNPKRLAKTRQLSDRKYRLNSPEKKKARNKISHAPRDGTIKRPTQCESCFKEGSVEGHHPDYSKLLKVVWLCKECHVKRHREIETGALVY